MSIFVVASSDGGLVTDWFDSLDQAETFINYYSSRGWSVKVTETELSL